MNNVERETRLAEREARQAKRMEERKAKQLERISIIDTKLATVTNVEIIEMLTKRKNRIQERMENDN